MAAHRVGTVRGAARLGAAPTTDDRYLENMHSVAGHVVGTVRGAAEGGAAPATENIIWPNLHSVAAHGAGAMREVAPVGAAPATVENGTPSTAPATDINLFPKQA